jgi:hypothetical protein
MELSTFGCSSTHNKTLQILQREQHWIPHLQSPALYTSIYYDNPLHCLSGPGDEGLNQECVFSTILDI